MLYALLAQTTVVTFSPSRACVHNACAVYSPEPSACKLITRRSGHATAAPTAAGGPWPIAPPVSARCANGGASSDSAQYAVPDVSDSSTMIASAGCSAATTAHSLLALSRPVGSAGALETGGGGGGAGGSSEARWRTAAARSRKSRAKLAVAASSMSDDGPSAYPNCATGGGAPTRSTTLNASK